MKLSQLVLESKIGIDFEIFRKVMQTISDEGCKNAIKLKYNCKCIVNYSNQWTRDKAIEDMLKIN